MGRPNTYTRNIDYFYHPTAWLICKGLNAPAMLVLVPFGGTWYFVPPIETFGLGRGLFLAAVGAVWYFVGRAIDQRRVPGPRKTSRPVTLLADLLLLLAGAVLFYAGFHEFAHPPALPTRLGGLLSMTWAVGFVFISIRSLLHRRRQSWPS